MSKEELTWENVKESLKFTPEEEAEIKIDEQIIEATINKEKQKNHL